MVGGNPQSFSGCLETHKQPEWKLAWAGPELTTTVSVMGSWVIRLHQHAHQLSYWGPQYFTEEEITVLDSWKCKQDLAYM